MPDHYYDVNDIHKEIDFSESTFKITIKDAAGISTVETIEYDYPKHVKIWVENSPVAGKKYRVNFNKYPSKPGGAGMTKAIFFRLPGAGSVISVGIRDNTPAIDNSTPPKFVPVVALIIGTDDQRLSNVSPIGKGVFRLDVLDTEAVVLTGKLTAYGSGSSQTIEIYSE